MNTTMILSALWATLKLCAVIYMGISLIQYWAERAAKKEERNNQITSAIRAIKVAEIKIESLEEKNDKLVKDLEQLEKAFLRGKVGK